MLLFFFCKQRTAYEMRICDWSTDVCSSDLGLGLQDAHRTDLGGGADVGAAVGLLVAAHDVDGADLGDRLGDQVDLGPDQVGNAESLAPLEDADRSEERSGGTELVRTVRSRELSQDKIRTIDTNINKE